VELSRESSNGKLECDPLVCGINGLCDTCRRRESAGISTSCNRGDIENAEGREDAEDRASGDDRDDTENGENTGPSLEGISLFSAPSLLPTAIQSTLPADPGYFKRCLFELARKLKGIAPEARPKHLRPIVQEWHRQASHSIKDRSFVDTWADFLQAWKKVKFPVGKGPIDIAFQRAQAAEPPPAVVKLYGEGQIVLLAMLCRELQGLAGHGEFFFLDCRTAGRLIRVDHSTAWRYLEVLCADGILLAGPKGSKAKGTGSKAKGTASRFQFIEVVE